MLNDLDTAIRYAFVETKKHLINLWISHGVSCQNYECSPYKCWGTILSVSQFVCPPTHRMYVPQRVLEYMGFLLDIYEIFYIFCIIITTFCKPWSIKFPIPIPGSLPENRCIPEGLCVVHFFHWEPEACPPNIGRGYRASFSIHTVSRTGRISIIKLWFGQGGQDICLRVSYGKHEKQAIPCPMQLELQAHSALKL